MLTGIIDLLAAPNILAPRYLKAQPVEGDRYSAVSSMRAIRAVDHWVSPIGARTPLTRFMSSADTEKKKGALIQIRIDSELSQPTLALLHGGGALGALVPIMAGLRALKAVDMALEQAQAVRQLRYGAPLLILGATVFPFMGAALGCKLGLTITGERD